MDHFYENSIFIGFWLTNRVSSKTELRFSFVRLDYLWPLTFQTKIGLPALFTKCCFLIGWTDGQTDRQTNIFCLQDPFFQKREYASSSFYDLVGRLGTISVPTNLICSSRSCALMRTISGARQCIEKAVPDLLNRAHLDPSPTCFETEFFRKCSKLTTWKQACINWWLQGGNSWFVDLICWFESDLVIWKWFGDLMIWSSSNHFLVLTYCVN